jgi:hypothetical protein
MEDGAAGDPRDIAPDKTGKLRHKDGRAVAYTEHGPRSRGVDPESERETAKPPARPKPAEPKPAAAKLRELKPHRPKGGYKTRESKAD